MKVPPSLGYPEMSLAFWRQPACADGMFLWGGFSAWLTVCDQQSMILLSSAVWGWRLVQMWVRAAGQTCWLHTAAVDYVWHNEEVEGCCMKKKQVSFVRICRAPDGCLCFCRYPGILPSSAKGYHRVCWTEDRCLSELKGGGERHPFLPPHRASSGRILLFPLSKITAAGMNVLFVPGLYFCLFLVNQYPGCARVFPQVCLILDSFLSEFWFHAGIYRRW